jgi:hypothetical protein
MIELQQPVERTNATGAVESLNNAQDTSGSQGADIPPLNYHQPAPDARFVWIIRACAVTGIWMGVSRWLAFAGLLRIGWHNGSLLTAGPPIGGDYVIQLCIDAAVVIAGLMMLKVRELSRRLFVAALALHVLHPSYVFVYQLTLPPGSTLYALTNRMTIAWVEKGMAVLRFSENLVLPILLIIILTRPFIKENFAGPRIRL